MLGVCVRKHRCVSMHSWYSRNILLVTSESNKQRHCFYGPKRVFCYTCVRFSLCEHTDVRPSLCPLSSLFFSLVNRHYAVAVSSHCANVTRALSLCHLCLLPAVHFDTSGTLHALSLTRNPDEHGIHTHTRTHVLLHMGIQTH